MAIEPEPAESIFYKAIELDDQSREGFLDEACGDDHELREEVNRLIADHARAGDFLEIPAANFPAVDLPPIAEGPGTKIGPYKLLQQIGDGGMGVVYMAEQEEPVKRQVALKVIKPGMDTRQVIARFEAERQALAIMDHMNIAKVLDAGATESGRPYFVMELVRGVPITDFCDENSLTARERLELFVAVCQAVQHAHQKGIIHRDIKPSNVMVTLRDDSPVVKVIDFGVAKATNARLTEQTIFTRFGQMVGTPLYMSPEQAGMSEFDVDTRSDIYSLGVLLYELLTGVTPFDQQRIRQAAYDELLKIIREEEPPKPSLRISTLGDTLPSVAAHRKLEPKKLSALVRGELDWIVMKALEKDRTRRYETATSFSADIERYLSDEAVEACPLSAAYRFRKFARRNRAVLTTATLVLITAMVGAGTSVWQAVRATKERDRAIAESRISAAVNAFLNEDLLAQANPENQPDPNVTLRAVVDRAAEKIEDRFADQPVVEAAVRYTLASTYEALGDYEEAKEHADRALQLRTWHLGADDSNTIRAEVLSASILIRQGDYQASRGQLEALLPRVRRELGPEDPVTLTVMHYLAVAICGQGDYEAAELLSRQTLEILRRKLGYKHPHTLSSMHCLALNYQEQHRYEEAEDLYRQTLDMRRRTLGDEHPDTLISMGNLGNVYWAQDRHDEAETLHRQTLEIRHRTLGDEHPDTITSMGNLGLVYQSQGRYDEAEELHRQSLEILRRTLGDEHPYTLIGMHCLARDYEEQDRYDEAEDLYRRTLEIQSRTLGDEHPHTLAFMKNLGLVQRKQGLYDEAEATFQKLVETTCRAWGDEHHMAIDGRENLAIIYLAQDRSEDREAVVRENLAIKIRALGRDDEGTRDSMRQLAAICVKKAEAHADAEDWPAALECLAPIIELHASGKDWRALTTLQLYLSDTTGYRRACEVAWKQFAQSERIFERAVLARFCGLAPQSGVDTDELVALATRIVEEVDNGANLLAKGMAEYRAGKFAEALATLPARDAGHLYPVSLLFLAMTHHQLGDHEAAREQYGRALKEIDRMTPTPNTGPEFHKSAPARWQMWLRNHVVHREAEALLGVTNDQPEDAPETDELNTEQEQPGTDQEETPQDE